MSGTYNKDITIGADNDIIVTDDFKSANLSTVLGGLIANNFVRVFHPVNNWNGNAPTATTTAGPASIQIDAAILALNHSFITDNWYCGNPLGTLTINGAIAQKFRGTVGTHSRRQSCRPATRRTTTTTTRCATASRRSSSTPRRPPGAIVRQNEQVPPR